MGIDGSEREYMIVSEDLGLVLQARRYLGLVLQARRRHLAHRILGGMRVPVPSFISSSYPAGIEGIFK